MKSVISLIMYLPCILADIPIYVNIYPMYKDPLMSQGIPSRFVPAHKAAEGIGLQISHSAVQIGNHNDADSKEWNFMGWANAPGSFWRLREIPPDADQRVSKQVFLCQTPLDTNSIDTIFKTYSDNNNYDVLRQNCNDAAFDVANLLCADVDGFVPKKQPGMCTRIAKLGRTFENFAKVVAPISGYSTSGSKSSTDETGSASEAEVSSRSDVES